MHCINFSSQFGLVAFLFYSKTAWETTVLTERESEKDRLTCSRSGRDSRETWCYEAISKGLSSCYGVWGQYWNMGRGCRGNRTLSWSRHWSRGRSNRNRGWSGIRGSGEWRGTSRALGEGVKEGLTQRKILAGTRKLIEQLKFQSCKHHTYIITKQHSWKEYAKTKWKLTTQILWSHTTQLRQSDTRRLPVSNSTQISTSNY